MVLRLLCPGLRESWAQVLPWRCRSSIGRSTSRSEGTRPPASSRYGWVISWFPTCSRINLGSVAKGVHRSFGGSLVSFVAPPLPGRVTVSSCQCPMPKPSDRIYGLSWQRGTHSSELSLTVTHRPSCVSFWGLHERKQAGRILRTSWNNPGLNLDYFWFSELTDTEEYVSKCLIFLYFFL